MNSRDQMQDELFHEDWRDALKHLVKALGGFDAAGAALFPHKTRHAAGSWLSDCLNEERPAKLDLEDLQALLRMGRDAGCHTGMYELCDAINYERPPPAAARSRRTEICDRMAEIAKEQSRLAHELDLIEGAKVVASLRVADK